VALFGCLHRLGSPLQERTLPTRRGCTLGQSAFALGQLDKCAETQESPSPEDSSRCRPGCRHTRGGEVLHLLALASQPAPASSPSGGAAARLAPMLGAIARAALFLVFPKSLSKAQVLE